MARPAVLAPAGLAFSAILWLGLLLGVSFLATPVKFEAASLTLPVALDVGRVTFALFSKVEWAMAALTTACFLAARPGRFPAIAVSLLVALLALQSIWLLPILDARLGAVIAGTPPPPSSHHVIYVAVEGVKALLLTGLGLSALRGVATGAIQAGEAGRRTSEGRA